MTNKEKILFILRNSSISMTCAEICKEMLFDISVNEKSLKQLNASISGELKKMINTNILEYDIKIKGPRGGQVYKIKPTKNETTKP